MAKPPRQLGLALSVPTRWGGARSGAGRKPAPRPRVRHRSRADFSRHQPGIVTIRIRRELPSLRAACVVRELERSWREACERGEFRVAQYSIQHDHVHLLVEAKDRFALARGMKSVAARLARAINRAFGRTGPVLDGRFHHRALATPREVRNALAYVLLNARKHATARGIDLRKWRVAIDPASSGRWFAGWANTVGVGSDAPAVARPRSWLLRSGWRRHGPVRPDEIPGGRG
jgi:REP element-mobilizing transposase RayT